MTHEGREDDVATPGTKIGDEVDDKMKDMGPDQRVKKISRRDDIDEKEKIRNEAEDDDEDHQRDLAKVLATKHVLLLRGFTQNLFLDMVPVHDLFESISKTFPSKRLLSNS